MIKTSVALVAFVDIFVRRFQVTRVNKVCVETAAEYGFIFPAARIYGRFGLHSIVEQGLTEHSTNGISLLDEGYERFTHALKSTIVV